MVKRKDQFILVISGGGCRGFYALGILKAIEELGLKKRIKAIFGISVGGVIATYWATGKSAQNIFEEFKSFNFLSSRYLNIPPKNSLFKNTPFKEKFSSELPKTFENLKLPVYIGCTDVKKARLVLFNKGEILSPLLGTMAIPGVFPPVSYQDHLLVDGGSIDNFPTTTAKRQYPKDKIIGIALNKFSEKQKIKNFLDNIMISAEIMMRRDIVKRAKEIDISFNEKINCKILETDKSKRKKAFEQGYESGIKKLGKFLKTESDSLSAESRKEIRKLKQ